MRDEHPKCNVCTKEFLNNADLDEHKYFHETVKCEECNKYVLKQDFKKHLELDEKLKLLGGKLEGWESKLQQKGRENKWLECIFERKLR